MVVLELLAIINFIISREREGVCWSFWVGLLGRLGFERGCFGVGIYFLLVLVIGFLFIKKKKGKRKKGF